jgi:hypothetical protein
MTETSSNNFTRNKFNWQTLPSYGLLAGNNSILHHCQPLSSILEDWPPELGDCYPQSLLGITARSRVNRCTAFIYQVARLLEVRPTLLAHSIDFKRKNLTCKQQYTDLLLKKYLVARLTTLLPIALQELPNGV